MSDLHVVILAAGKGTRMRSARPKVLHPLAGRPLISHVLRTVSTLEAATTTIVIGHGADEVRTALAAEPGLAFVVQSPQLGTGHALLQTEPMLQGRKARCCCSTPTCRCCKPTRCAASSKNITTRTR
jgi:bifunctional UDP-N-acetylglucosamine pyrophosphorylase/glucosamine-1-phosphate N-acetyltransferase